MHNGDYYDDHGRSDAAGWSAFLAGAFIGAGLALLFAPQTGNELRGKSVTQLPARTKDDVMDRGREAWDTAVDRGREYVERGQESMQEAGRTAREYVQSGQERLKEAGKEAVSKFKEASHEASEAASDRK